MSVRFKCSNCQTILKARETDAGKIAKCKHCQTKMRIPTPPNGKTDRQQSLTKTRVDAPHSATVTGPPKSTQPGNAGVPPVQASATARQVAESVTPDDDPFGDLPEFQQVDQVVAKPRRADDDFRTALQQTHIAADSNSASETNADVGSGEAGLLEGMSTEEIVSAVIAQQQRRNQAAIAPKVNIEEIQRAFQKEMNDFDRSASVKGRSMTVALTVLILPLAFSCTVVLMTLAMLALPLGLLPISFAAAMTWGGVLWYPLGWLFLFAAWIPVFNLFFAAMNVLFSGAKETEAQRTLTVENQPVMYEFVAQVCQKVGAPAPTRIELDTEFNASASFRQGWASFGKNDLVLTLGIPLIACQSAGQLASVLAHEFGHFRQGSAMRSNYMIRSLTGWFIERAHWGHVRARLMDQYQDSEDSNDSVLAVISFIGFVGRQMMLGFGLAGHAIAGSLSREMEYDADRHAVHLAGTKNFIESMARVERYGVAHAVTIENLRMLYVSGGLLVDNIPRLMLHIGKTMPIDVVRRIADAKQTEKQERLDTHPPTRDRVKAAQEINQAGVFRMDRPATDLIRNWATTCEECTIDYYSSVLADPVTKEQLTPLEKVLASEHRLLLDA